MELFVCAPHEIDRAWAEGAHKLSEACKWAGREITPDQLKMLLSRGERTLIGLRDQGKINAWFAVQVSQLPNIRILYVYALQGAGACCAEGHRLLSQFAQANGCSTIRGAVRPSMMRLLRQRFGADALYTTFEVPLWQAADQPNL